MIVGISKQIIKIMMRGESLSYTDSAWPRLEQLVPVYGGHIGPATGSPV